MKYNLFYLRLDTGKYFLLSQSVLNVWEMVKTFEFIHHTQIKA